MHVPTRISLAVAGAAALVVPLGCAQSATNTATPQQAAVVDTGPGSTVKTTEADWKPAADALGLSGKLNDDGGYRIGIPRRDLTVTVADTPIKPGFALGGYAVFVGTPGDAVMVGDLVLLEPEINPTLSALQAAGIHTTALHRHLESEAPRLMYMHYMGQGDATTLAKGLHDALGHTATPLTPAPASQASSFSFDTSRIDQALGHKGKDNGGSVYNVTIARPETIHLDGRVLPPSAGVTTSLNFEDLGGGKAAINGDFAATPSQLDAMLKALRDQNIDVVSTHQHMTDDDPRLIYTHFWATGDAADLANRLAPAVHAVTS